MLMIMKKDFSKEVDSYFTEKSVKNIIGEKELDLPLNKKSYIMRR